MEDFPSDDPILSDKAFDDALCPQCQNHPGMSYSELKQLALDAQQEIQRLHAENTALKQTVQRLEFCPPSVSRAVGADTGTGSAVNSEAQLRATVAVLREENHMLAENMDRLRALKGVQDPKLAQKTNADIVRLKMTIKELMRQLEQSRKT